MAAGCLGLRAVVRLGFWLGMCWLEILFVFTSCTRGTTSVAYCCGLDFSTVEQRPEEEGGVPLDCCCRFRRGIDTLVGERSVFGTPLRLCPHLSAHFYSRYVCCFYPPNTHLRGGARSPAWQEYGGGVGSCFFLACCALRCVQRE